MNARMWTSWCSAALLTATSGAGDAVSTPRNPAAPPAINYSLADSELPSPKILNSKIIKSVKPLAPKREAAKQVVVTPSPETKQPNPRSIGNRFESMLPIPAPESKMTMVEPAIAKTVVAPTGSSVAPVGAYLPTVDDHVKCVECLKTLSGSPIESDRKAALAELGKMTAWKQMKTAYMILRRVALTEYNTKMRADAVKLLGESMMEHALAADTLKLSAQYDSDRAIRATALAQLERLAALPPDRVTR